MIALLALETTAIPASAQIEMWRKLGRSQDADTLQNGLLAFWITFFSILIISTLYNYFKVYERCVGIPRINMVLTDKRGPEYFEGIGITTNRTYQTAAVDISRYLEDHELVDVFNRFVKDRMAKYPGLDLKVNDDHVKILDKIKDYFESRAATAAGVKPGDEIKKLRLTPEGIDERNIRWQGYELEYYMAHEFENYFSPKVIEWLANEKILSRDNMLAQRNYDLENLQTKFKNTNPPIELAQGEVIDFVKSRSWMNTPFDYFYPEEIKFFKSKGIMTMGELLTSNLGRIEREFNQFIAKVPTGSKLAIKWAAFKLKLKIDYVPLKKEVDRLKKETIKWEKDFLVEFSKNKFDNFLDVRIAKVRSMYYQYFLEYVEIDEPIGFNVERMTQDEKPDEDKKRIPPIPIKRFLMILPDSFGNSLHFRPKKILFEGYDISCPKVAEAEFVFHSIIVHNIALLYCNSCDYTRNSIQEDFHVDIDKFHEVVKSGLVNVIDELDASLDKLRVKIANRDKRIEAFKETEDDKFEQWGADLDKTSNPIREIKPPSKTNLWYLFLAIILGIMCLVIGFFLGRIT